MRALQIRGHDIDDAPNLFLGELLEHDNLVDTVQELRSEGFLHRVHNEIFDLLVLVGVLSFLSLLLEAERQRGLVDELRTDVGGHDDDRILEVDRASLAVRKRPSSRICSKTLNTSGCAFSISSKRITLYGLRRTASVS